jgi:hypothetical protein
LGEPTQGSFIPDENVCLAIKFPSVWGYYVPAVKTISHPQGLGICEHFLTPRKLGDTQVGELGPIESNAGHDATCFQ